MKARQRLFFIGAGPEMKPGIEWAKEMGLEVVATDMNPRAVGLAAADHAEVVSTRDVAGTVAAAQKWHRRLGLDGVMTLAADVPVTMAAVAQALNLPGLDMETAVLAQDKLAMKQRLKEKGIPIPRFAAGHTLAEVKEACQEIGFPVVIKPIDNCAARGVSLVKGETEIKAAFEWAQRHQLKERIVLVEEYLPGPQISTESLIWEGRIYTTGFADRNYELNEQFKSCFVEDGHTIPSELPPSDQAAVTSLAEEAIQALGLDFGVGKGDLVLTPQGPKVIELAARLSGGRFSTDTVPLASGVNIVKAMIKIAVGEPIDPLELRPKFARAAAQRFLWPRPGLVERIKNPWAGQRPEWLHRVEIYVQPGDEVLRVTNHAQRAGYVIAKAQTRTEAVARAEEARAAIRIETEGDKE